VTEDELVLRLRAAGCVFAEEEAALLLAETDDPAELERMTRLRVDGLPLEHVLGWAEFSGRRYSVAPGVFVPRPRTEHLVDLAIARGGSTVLDLCCGSGAIGAAVAAGLGAELYSTELDPVAAAVARRNVQRVYEGDLFDPLPRGLLFDLIVVVAPYVPTAEIALLPHEARDFEPLLALDGGADGLDLVRRILAEAPEWLAPRGALLTEVSEEQAPVVVQLAEAAGFRAAVDGTVVTATR
jgi:release factor glutamine methyltransferase